jgi:prepilin-type N-terminal cleavage/methylation domain-containing protein
MNERRGFTLIELLVVISIIALLSSIIFASLNSARGKAEDNAVKAAMKQVAIQAENYRDANPSFGLGMSSCASGVFNDSRIIEQKVNILANAREGAVLVCTTSANGALWALSISALKGVGTGWCVDNSSGFKASASNAGGICS